MVSRKFLTIILTIFSFLVVGIGFYRFKNAIYAPFKKETSVEQEQQLTKDDYLNVLSEQDTDQDGLSDFDERFNYQTSLFIFDTDGDGFNDGQEISQKTDPLNPLSNIEQIKTAGKDADASNEILEKNVTSPNQEESTDNQELSVREIKSLLINQAGLSQEIVDKIDGKTLKELYNETKKETGTDLFNLQNGSQLPEEYQSSIGNSLGLSISEIRQSLIEQGIDAEMLRQIDDQTLEEMFEKSMLEIQQ